MPPWGIEGARRTRATPAASERGGRAAGSTRPPHSLVVDVRHLAPARTGSGRPAAADSPSAPPSPPARPPARPPACPVAVPSPRKLDIPTTRRPARWLGPVSSHPRSPPTTPFPLPHLPLLLLLLAAVLRTSSPYPSILPPPPAAMRCRRLVWWAAASTAAAAAVVAVGAAAVGGAAAPPSGVARIGEAAAAAAAVAVAEAPAVVGGGGGGGGGGGTPPGGARPPATSRQASATQMVWVSPKEWSTFLSDAARTMHASGASPWAVHDALHTLVDTPVAGAGGWRALPSTSSWARMGAAIGRVMVGRPPRGAPRQPTGRSHRCTAAARACARYWNFSGCTRRSACCCPPYCQAVFSSFGAIRIAAGRATGVHGCCVESFC
ncbi:hypothetical protein I4F81_003630 [Pyropia yezoensis]|uniref:Uncharacterized protein n=1 Tax=Pyropia yezoensis TaxID=2788 RepID=A0ACC3BSP3_PYRYE|nr:hypothetical protein I4F81_003630 [Neopyropia yezoensis]